MKRKKWWEVATTNEETKLFELLCRNPKYEWRNISTILEHVKMDMEEFQKMIYPYVKNKILLTRRGEKGVYLGYWEIVDSSEENIEMQEPEVADPNII